MPIVNILSLGWVTVARSVPGNGLHRAVAYRTIYKREIVQIGTAPPASCVAYCKM